MSNEPHYYVDTNMLVYLGFIEKSKNDGLEIEEIREDLSGKLYGRPKDVEGLLILYDKVKNKEVKLVATPTVIFETVKPVLFYKRDLDNIKIKATLNL